MDQERDSVKELVVRLQKAEWKDTSGDEYACITLSSPKEKVLFAGKKTELSLYVPGPTGKNPKIELVYPVFVDPTGVQNSIFLKVEIELTKGSQIEEMGPEIARQYQEANPELFPSGDNSASPSTEQPKRRPRHPGKLHDSSV